MLLAVEALLRAHHVDGKPVFGVVGTAFNVAMAMKDGLRSPRQAYVVPLPTSFGAATQDLGPLSQLGRVEFGVVVGMKVVDDAKGEKGAVLIDSTMQALCRCLLGKVATSDTDRIELTRTEPIGVADNAVWMLYRFKTTVRVHQES